MGISVNTDFSNITTRLDQMKRGFPDDLDTLMDQAGRLIAVSLATSTIPFGTSDKARAMGEHAVIRDIYRVYATKGQAYKEVMSNSSKSHADGFYRALGNGNLATARGILSQSAPRFGLAEIGPFDGGALHRSRRTNRGRVSASQKVLLIVTNVGALKEYILKEVKQVGFGKAGWANCARAFKETGATRGLPQWVTRHRDAPASVAKHVTGATITVNMINQVPYAQYLSSPADQQVAAGIAIDRLSKSYFRGELAAARTGA